VLYRRICRLISGWFWSIVYFFEGLLKCTKFKLTVMLHRIPEKYLWEAFAHLAGLDMTEKMRTDSGMEVQGCGYFLDIHDTKSGAHFVLSQTDKATMFIQEYRTIQREVKMEFGSIHKTNWWEIYRTGRLLDVDGVNRVLWYLKELYGEGTNAVQKQSTNAVYVRKTS